MKRRTVVVAVVLALVLVPVAVLMLHLSGGRAWAFPVSGDPGISWMVVTDTPAYRVLRDYAKAGATRRMHHHEATWHALTLATGTLVLTVEGESPMQLSAGQTVTLAGGVAHTFTNPGTETATIVEVFGKHP